MSNFLISLRRRWRGLTVTVVSVAVVLALVVFVLPTHLARWVLDSKLDDLGLQGRGTETVDIDLWNSEIRFGPLTIGAPGAEPARLERFGLKYSLSRLFSRRGLGKETVVEGLILDVARDAEGRITVNGIDIFELMPQSNSEPPEKETDGAWGVGLRQFVLRDSRVRFHRHDGGELAMEIGRLALDGFQTWTPEAPGRFDLQAMVNGIVLELDGTAKPFSDRIEVVAKSKLSAVELEKIQRFTGRLPLTRGDGTLQASLQHKASLSPDGTVEISNTGRVTVDALSVSLPDGPDLAFANAVLDLDTEQVFSPDRSIGLTGTLKVEGKQTELRLPDGSKADLDKTVIQLSEMKLSADPTQRVEGSLSLAVQAAAGKASRDGQQLRFAALGLAAAMSDLSVRPNSKGSAAITATLKLEKPAVEGAVQGSADVIALRATDAKVTNGDAAFSVMGGASVDVAALNATVAESEDAPALALKAGSLEIADGQITLTVPAAGTPSWQGTFGLGVRETSIAVKGDYSGTVAIDRFQMASGAIDDALHTAFENLQIDGLTASGADLPFAAKAGSGSFDRLHLSAATFGRARQSTLETLALDGLSLTLEALPSIPGLTDAGQLSARLSQLRATGGVRDVDGGVSLRELTLGSLASDIQGKPGADAKVAAFRIENLALTPELQGSTDTVAMSGLTVNIGGGEAMKLRLKKLDLEKLAGTGAPSLQVADISLQGLILSASSALLPPDSEVAEQPETVDEPSASSEISIGRVTLEGPAEIALTDKRQSPAVSLKTKINRFEVQNFNTVQPAVKSSLAIAATINEFTDLSVGGWFNLAGDRPNFDLKTTFENLELPSFSRYAATHLGVNLESGRLSAEAEGKVVEGQLDAATKLNLLNLRFSPLSPEDSKRLSAATGVPIETAVGLLEDSDGKIELSIPVKGDLQNPDFDLDQVVGKAVGNAIAATIGTTLKVLFPPALLLSAFDAASEGGGVKFAPAPFDAGTTTLQPKGRELVDALASLLKQRPKLTVTLCGRATNDDVKAVLRPEVEAAMAERRAAYARDMATYRVRLRPFIEAGVVDEAGKPLTKEVPKDLPAAPEQPVLDEASILAGHIAGRADELRDRLTALAADRTKAIRRDMAERLNVARGQVAECRPLFDLKDTAGPRAVFQL